MTGSGQDAESCQTSLGIEFTRSVELPVRGGVPSTDPPEIQIKLAQGPRFFKSTHDGSDTSALRSTLKKKKIPPRR